MLLKDNLFERDSIENDFNKATNLVILLLEMFSTTDKPTNLLNINLNLQEFWMFSVSWHINLVKDSIEKYKKKIYQPKLK